MVHFLNFRLKILAVRNFQKEYGSQQVLASGINGFTNNVSGEF